MPEASRELGWGERQPGYRSGGDRAFMGGDLAGMVCDGAKGGCAFKLATASSEAILTARLAKNDIIISDGEGIVGNGAETTIRNLGKLCVQGMENVDRKIIEVMQGM